MIAFIFFSDSLRFLRRIVGLKDEFYNRYIVKGQLFDPVIATFKENGQRYNLLNSAIVELFEFIRAVSAVISSFTITLSAMDCMFKLSSVENWLRCDPKHVNNLLNTGSLAFSNICKFLNNVVPYVQFNNIDVSFPYVCPVINHGGDS